MSGTSGPDGDDTGPTLRELLSSLQALVALSMQMTDSDDEAQILQLGDAAVVSLARCRLVGTYLEDVGWHAGPDGAGERAEVEAQLSVVSTAGGAIVVGHDEWGWAFPLRSSTGHFGFLAIGAGDEPSSGEQFLLRVLAQQIGTALANARLHARQRRHAAELVATSRQLAATVAVLERSAAIQERLTQVALAGGGQAGIARAVHELTGFTVTIEDRHGNVRAWAGPRPTEPIAKAGPADREAMLQRACEAEEPIRHDGRLLVVARPRDDAVGVVALVDPEGVAGEEARVALQHAATVLGLELVRLASIAETELRLGRGLVDELLDGADEASAIARAEALGYDLERPHRAVVVEVDTDPPEPLALFHATRRAARECGVGTMLASRGASIVVLADTDRPWEVFRTAVARELHGASCRVGVGSACDKSGDLRRSYREALFALRVQALAGAGDHATSFDELGVYRLLGGLPDLDDVERFASTWLGALLAYDAGRDSSELVATLRQYLACGGNYDATAHALSVHRSTLKYRLHRIREISGHDLNSPETQFNLQLALRAWQTLHIRLSETPPQ
ncbi:PucR family transcriptional regulator [Dermatobacter hominis]|uniref:PucR family transcriptional regulator n=1 Tax=Dermatobacter hominis TaxID=2884263 RepID=UPI001D0F6AF7|nr:helix-turn-helix domain-containing protein [Dermatobacter hominis]UDY37664.1 helix-turn-helix domain-containing protein [Dermatobacter hominis]